MLPHRTPRCLLRWGAVRCTTTTSRRIYAARRCVSSSSSASTTPRIVSVTDLPRRQIVPHSQIPGRILLPAGTLREPNRLIFRDWTGTLCSVLVHVPTDDLFVGEHNNDAKRNAERKDSDPTTATTTAEENNNKNDEMILDALPQFLQEQDTAIVLHAPQCDIECATGHYELHVTTPPERWSLPTTVAGYNTLADQSTHPMWCAQSAWAVVPQLRRRMAVLLTNLAAATLANSNTIAALWYAGTATVLDPNVGQAWKVLVDALEAFELHRTAYIVVQQQAPEDNDTNEQLAHILNPLRNRLGKYATRSNQRPGRTDDDNAPPTCWSHVLPPDPLDMVNILPPPRKTSLSSQSSTAATTAPLRELAKKYFRAGDYEAACDKLRLEWYSLPSTAQDLSRTLQHMLMDHDHGGDSRYAIASLVVDPTNPTAWIRISDGYAMAGEAPISQALLQQQLLLSRVDNDPAAVLRYRQALHRLQELSSRPSIQVVPQFQRRRQYPNRSMGVTQSWRTREEYANPAVIDAFNAQAPQSVAQLRDYVALLCKTSSAAQHQQQNPSPYEHLHYLSRRTVPKLHDELLADPLPFGLDIDRVRRRVLQGYWNACSQPWQLATPMVTQGQLAGHEDYALQRWGGSNDRVAYVQAHADTLQPGDQVPILRYTEDDDNDDDPHPIHIRSEYNPHLQSMYINCPTHPAVGDATTSTTTTHVSLGCNDLSELLVLWQDDEEEGTRQKKWIGVDQSPFAIARSLVVLEMLHQDPDDVDIASVFEVWYSTVWSTDSVGAFLRACHSVLEDSNVHPAVAHYIRYWRDTAMPIPGAAGRAKYWHHTERRPDQMFCRYATSSFVDCATFVLSPYLYFLGWHRLNEKKIARTFCGTCRQGRFGPKTKSLDQRSICAAA